MSVCESAGLVAAQASRISDITDVTQPLLLLCSSTSCFLFLGLDHCQCVVQQNGPTIGEACVRWHWQQKVIGLDVVFVEVYGIF